LLVTGASGGLGQAVTARLLASGARVVACDRQEDLLDRLRSQLSSPDRFHALAADVSRAELIADLFDRAEREAGPITGVAHLVGGYHGGTSIEETSEEIWDQMISLNLRNAFLVTREAVRRMRARGQGSIVVVSSAASIPGSSNPGAAAYAASKAGLNALVEAAAAENRSHGVRINAVLPTLMRTRANVEAMPDAAHDQWVTPEEVAQMIHFLLSPAASGVDGALIRVSGRQ
jgi:NAD(P)-dependent dehydrogenase (short-subunit alcohol dehydrogenase family)